MATPIIPSAFDDNTSGGMSSAKSPEGSSSPEAPVVPPAVRRRLQQCYEHAKKLMAQPKYDFDYANTALTDCVVHDPGNLVYVELFLENLKKKYDDNRKGAKLQLFLNRGPFKKALAGKQWLEVLKTGPELLKTNPWDAATLRGMAEACEQLQFNEVELRYLKNALDGSPKDADVNRHCARSLARMGQYDQAIACWARVAEIKRNDPEAQKMIGDLQIEKTKWKFGMLTPEERKRGAGSPAGPKTAESPKPAPASTSAEPEAPVAETKKREIPLTKRQQLERSLQEDPGNVSVYLQLADAYGEEGKLADAERVLQKGLAASGNDLQIRERLEELQVVRVKQQLAVAERRLQAERTEAAKTLVQQLKENLNRLELDLYGQRAQRYPAEGKWKLELAIRLKRSGNFSEALKWLEEVAAEDQQAAAIKLETGECWQHLKQYPKALGAYQEACELAAQAGDAEKLKLALYRGGVLGKAMSDPAGSAMLSRLVDLDPTYRDAAQRLQAAK
jgi:tetratricopeptide (TPR) repeat protein